MCNVRCTYLAWKSGLDAAFDIALRGGSVMGFCLVSLGVINLYVLMLILSSESVYGQSQDCWEAIAGYGFGGSSIALFARVGGGIYTKAADVGADLSGKNEWGMAEDDPRNPACIADNVGDNVGDIAGMGADLFGSFAESTCAALLLTGACKDVEKWFTDDWGAMSFPILVSSVGILVGLITVMLVRVLFSVKQDEDIERNLKMILVISTTLESLLLWGVAALAFPSSFVFSDMYKEMSWWKMCTPVQVGLWAGLLIGLVTEHYTSRWHTPVQEIAESQKVSAATGVIFGLALGYWSCVLPAFVLGGTVVIAFKLCGMYGVALAALGMLSTLTMALTIDAFGPICDNAGGLAEMAQLPKEVRDRTDALDAAGNTTAAVGKGFAIGSAALVSLALFGAYCELVGVKTVNILNPWCFLGLICGTMLPFAFSAMTMRSVGQAANEMVKECMEQFPKIVNEQAEPDYQRCIEISTRASLREMVCPGCLVVLSPIVMGCLFGCLCTAGLLAGSMCSGVMMAVSMSNSGGAWDNSKKHIKAGGLGEEHMTNDTHKNAVTGDTIGDPMKDTSGPSLNILVKLSAITAVIFAHLIRHCSNEAGGPAWLKEENVGNGMSATQ